MKQVLLFLLITLISSSFLSFGSFDKAIGNSFTDANQAVIKPKEAIARNNEDEAHLNKLISYVKLLSEFPSSVDIKLEELKEILDTKDKNYEDMIIENMRAMIELAKQSASDDRRQEVIRLGEEALSFLNQFQEKQNEFIRNIARIDSAKDSITNLKEVGEEISSEHDKAEISKKIRSLEDYISKENEQNEELDEKKYYLLSKCKEALFKMDNDVKDFVEIGDKARDAQDALFNNQSFAWMNYYVGEMLSDAISASRSEDVADVTALLEAKKEEINEARQYWQEKVEQSQKKRNEVRKNYENSFDSIVKRLKGSKGDEIKALTVYRESYVDFISTYEKFIEVRNKSQAEALFRDLILSFNAKFEVILNEVREEKEENIKKLLALVPEKELSEEKKVYLTKRNASLAAGVIAATAIGAYILKN